MMGQLMEEKLGEGVLREGDKGYVSGKMIAIKTGWIETKEM